MANSLAIPDDAYQKLRQYQDVLLKWQSKINLISPNTIKESWNRHFEDSLQILPFIPSHVKTLYDLGTGAGFPGLVIAIIRSDIKVTLIESDSKKCAFLQTVSRETGVDVSIVNDRIDVAVKKYVAPNLVTARALASLNALLDMCHPWAKQYPKMTAIFLKGERFQAEIGEALAAGWAFHVEQFQSKTDKDSRILRLSDIDRPKS